MAKRYGRKRRGDWDPGELGVSGILRGIGNFVELLSDMLDEGRDEWSKSGEVKFPGESGPIRGIYGISVRMGPGGIKGLGNFGNIREHHGTPVIEEVREPLIDVFDEGDHVLIVAEMPGVQQKDIKLSMDGDVLTILAQGSEYKYRKEVFIPKPVDFASRTLFYSEGILRLNLPVVGGSS